LIIFRLTYAKVEADNDKTTFKVYLNDNIQFSNGVNINADDVLYSLSLVPLEKNYIVEKIDDKTLQFKIKSGTPSVFLENLTYPIVYSKETYEKNFSTDLVTSGFFKIKSVTKDADGNVLDIVLKRYNNGEDKIPYLKTYTIFFFKDDTDAYTSFQRKEIDLLSGIQGSTISKIKDDTGIELSTSTLPNNFAVFFNQNENEVLRDPDLRQALSDSVDRSTLTNQILGSFGLPEKNLLGETQKVKNADEIVKKLPSSFSFENGVLYTSTKKTPKQGSTSKSQVKIKLTTISNSELEQTAKLIANSWQKIGVQTDIDVIDKKDLNSVVKNRDFEALLFGFSIKSPKDYYSFFSSKERTYPKLNISNYTQKDADRILESLESETDERKIADYVQKLSDIIERDNPVIILYKPEFVFAHFLKTKIKLPEEIKSEENRYEFVNYWYTDTEKVLPLFTKIRIPDLFDQILY
jgi:ABC-type transport system substrate-binding protein